MTALAVALVTPDALATAAREAFVRGADLVVCEVGLANGTSGRVSVRHALLHALSGCLGLPSGRVPLWHDVDGRPHVVNQPTGAGWQVSCTHAGTHGAFAISHGQPVGIDVEPVDPRRFPDHVADHILHPRELARYRQHAPAERPGRLARTWVAKEALLKGLGLGLRVDPRTVELPEDDDAGTVVAAGWRLQVWIENGVALAVASANARPRVGRLALQPSDALP